MKAWWAAAGIPDRPNVVKGVYGRWKRIVPEGVAPFREAKTKTAGVPKTEELSWDKNASFLSTISPFDLTLTQKPASLSLAPSADLYIQA